MIFMNCLDPNWVTPNNPSNFSVEGYEDSENMWDLLS